MNKFKLKKCKKNPSDHIAGLSFKGLPARNFHTIKTGLFQKDYLPSNLHFSSNNKTSKTTQNPRMFFLLLLLALLAAGFFMFSQGQAGKVIDIFSFMFKGRFY